ncbi:molecular chaperone GrpE [Actinocrispum wychmicini]|uniref:Protein GrpE n=1 Tax=Actinocrispum wychmicini TaxID=1213861 RepID=A0A4R2JZU1_9PSEU|nr:molecular chaperone GrpE [Actinocrispum wychmicini]
MVVRDRRRIDPESGEVRSVPEAAEEVPADEAGAVVDGEAPAAQPPIEAEILGEALLQAQLDERTADLQRLQAEYANYRKRVDRDREGVIANAKASVASELLGVLDDIERAAAHGDLTGAFKSVADKLIATVQRVGLEPFGHENEPFDPAVHEAVQHGTSSDVSGPTVTAVLRRGYRFGERTLRPALVAVTDHEAEEQKPVEAEWIEPSDGESDEQR